MKNGVFISYRRSDSAGGSDRLSDNIKQAFPFSDVFLDVDNLAPGIDFAQELKSRIEASRVMLLMIGPGWAKSDEGGKSRLHDPDDFVRMEIEHALQGGCIIVPVLSDDAEMPAREDLPESIQSITGLNAVTLRHARFQDDAKVITDFLATHLEPVRPFWRRPMVWIGGACAALVLILVVYFALPEGRTIITASPDTSGTVSAAISEYLEPGHEQDFLVLTAKSRKEFVQFIGVPGDDTRLLLDLPHGSLNEEQMARARKWFADAGEREAIEYRTDISSYPTFNLTVPREKSVILNLVREVFVEIYGFDQLPAVRVRMGS